MYGVEADFVANENCKICFILAEDFRVRLVSPWPLLIPGPPSFPPRPPALAFFWPLSQPPSP